MKKRAYFFYLYYSNYSLAEVVFKQHAIGWEWGMVAVSCAAYAIIVEIYKFFKRKFVLY